MRLVHQYLRESAQRHPDRAALICDEKELSYGELISRIDTLADMFIVEGLRKSDRVLVLLRDKIEFIIACYAVMRAGGIAVPIAASNPSLLIEHIARDCDPFALITSKTERTIYSPLQDALSCHFFFSEGTAASSTLSASRTSAPQTNHSAGDIDRITKLLGLQEDDGAAILYTSGTGGQKNGVLLTHRNLTARHETGSARPDSQLREFVAPPLWSSFGFSRVGSLLFTGGTAVVTNREYHSLTIAQSILTHQCNALSMIPETFSLLYSQIETLLKQIGPLIRSIEVGSFPMSLREKQRLLDTFPHGQINLCYELTEASRSMVLDLRVARKKLETSGHPSPNVRVSICDEHGTHLGKETTGEITIQGDHVAPCYWRNEELTKRSFLKGHWFRTGDLGFIDKDNYLHLLGRKDELINVAGMKISPSEIEGKVNELYPDCEVCVVGVPDPERVAGEVPVLCYVPRNGKTIIPSELSTALSGQLDQNKIPRIVFRVESFPRIENKIIRLELRKKLLEGIPHSG